MKNMQQKTVVNINVMNVKKKSMCPLKGLVSSAKNENYVINDSLMTRKRRQS